MTDIHRAYIDQITIISPTSGKTLLMNMSLIVGLNWFNAFASQKYHLNSEINYPADFIAEGLDQTRVGFILY